MCRSNLYFKGMSRVTEKWDREFDDQKWEDVYADAFTAVEGVEDGEDFLMFLEELELAYKNIRNLYDMGYDFSWEFIREVLKNPFCFTSTIVKPVRYEIWDDFKTIWKQNMFVSRYPQWRGLRI